MQRIVISMRQPSNARRTLAGRVALDGGGLAEQNRVPTCLQQEYSDPVFTYCLLDIVIPL